MSRIVKQYGTWDSPLSIKMLSEPLRLNDVGWDSDGETLVWVESRGGRGVLVAQRGVQAPRDLTESDLSVRGGIGYGGGEFAVRNGVVYFAAGGRLYRQTLAGGRPRPLTPAFGQCAAPCLSPDGRWLVYVHSDGRSDTLALVNSEGAGWPRKLAQGSDFYMQPTWHPGGARLAYITWNTPAMPWDATELRLASLSDDGTGMPFVESAHRIAGDASTSIMQPEFSPDGRWLAYLSDAGGWWQIYLYDLVDESHRRLTDVEAEHGVPAWTQGTRSYGWSADSRAIYGLRSREGRVGLWRFDIASGGTQAVVGLEHYSALRQLAVAPTGSTIALLASTPTLPERVISLGVDQGRLPERLVPNDVLTLQVSLEEPRGEQIHRRSSSENLQTSYIAPEAISWPGGDGETIYGLHYAPTNERFAGVGLPPLIVISHGGPTSQRPLTYSDLAQFFATRGLAVLEVNYRGSTGYGRAYRERLRGMWGVYDVEDCASGAAYLSERGLIDPAKRVIYGSSAGGYTVLQSLVNKPGFYRAGICLYGISDLFTLVSEADFKFEAHYTEALAGALPDAAELYRQRSPLFHADRIVDPVAIFHGEDDRVVPKSQADALAAVLKARSVPHEYQVYAGEGHGWRKAETIDDFYNRVLAFLRRWVIYA